MTQDQQHARGDHGMPADEGCEVVLACAYMPERLSGDLFGLTEEQLLDLVARTLDRVGLRESAEVSLLVTDDDGLRALNAEYRGKDEATDVLSFPLSDVPLVEAPADQLWQPAEDEPAEDEDDLAPLAGGDDADTPDTLDDLDEADELAALDELADLDAFAEGDDGADDEDDMPLAALNGAGHDEPPLALGDIAISHPTTLRQASRAGHGPAYEFAFLLVHGVLHLVGYDDHTEAGYRAMVAHQEAILGAAGIAH